MLTLTSSSLSLLLGHPNQLMEGICYIPERLTKMDALRNDQAWHRRIEPNLRSVVFTQHLGIYDACVRGLKQDGLEVYQLTSSSDSCKRDIQTVTSHRPVVFVITLNEI